MLIRSGKLFINADENQRSERKAASASAAIHLEKGFGAQITP